MDFWGDDMTEYLSKTSEFSQRIKDIIRFGKPQKQSDRVVFFETSADDIYRCPKCDSLDASDREYDYDQRGDIEYEFCYSICDDCGHEWDYTEFAEVVEVDLIPIGVNKLGEAFWGSPIPPALW